MKKYALCLHGLSSGISEKVPGSSVNISNLFSELNKNLIEPNNCDIFFHTWKHENIDNLISTYKPQRFEVEDHIVFHKNTFVDNVKHLRRKYFLGHNHKNRRNDIMSRWYSMKKSVNFATSYSEERGFIYNKIFVTRFDMLLKKKVNLSLFHPEKFYVGHWPRWFDKKGSELNEIDVSKGRQFMFKGKKGFPYDEEGLHDFWFAANCESISRFARCYDNLPSLFNQVGLSSHKIALKNLENIGLVEHLEFSLEFPSDYTLGRWS